MKGSKFDVIFYSSRHEFAARYDEGRRRTTDQIGDDAVQRSMRSKINSPSRYGSRTSRLGRRIKDPRLLPAFP